MNLKEALTIDLSKPYILSKDALKDEKLKEIIAPLNRLHRLYFI